MMKKKNGETLDEISVGSFVHMKKDVTTTSYNTMDYEDAKEKSGK